MANFTKNCPFFKIFRQFFRNPTEHGAVTLISMLKLCLGFFVDTLFCVKWLARLSIYIHADNLVLISEFVVVVILSEWWSVPTTADHCGHISAIVCTCVYTYILK